MGFRPFFFGAGVWAALAMFLWILNLAAGLELPVAMDTASWHAHEMIFGFGGAAVAGFLLTAIPNWTGRLPVKGFRLAALFLLWCAGRITVAISAPFAAAGFVWLPALIDASFLAVFAIAIAREILLGRNWRNGPVVIVVALFALANAADHAALAGLDVGADLRVAQRFALALLALLIGIIGGRIVPSFTRNWLKKEGADVFPAQFGRLDRAGIAALAGAGAAWTVWPFASVTGWLLVAAGSLTGWRLARWRGSVVGGEPLLWVLHLGYAWLAASLVALGASILTPGIVLPFAALHALAAGAIGTMTLAVMTRATLGHSGRALAADATTAAIYALVTAAALLRLVSAYAAAPTPWLIAAAVAWIGAFLLFVVRYAPLWLTQRE